MGENKVVGHKTLGDGKGGYYHEPLYADEAVELLRQVEERKAQREALMPDEDAALKLFFDAWLRLKDFGWREACYCPKDGRAFEAIEAGSSGRHRCHYSGEWPKGGYWIEGNGDLWPSHPVLFRDLPTPTREAGE